MDLRKEERKGQSNKRVLSEIDVSEWEITYKEIRPCEGKRSYISGKTTQLLEGETHSQAEILGTQRERSSYCQERSATSFTAFVDNLSISKEIARTLISTNPSSRIRT
jgi:hypothetical protein